MNTLTKPFRLLVVEDTTSYRRLIGALLDELSVCHVVVPNCEAALRVIADNDFDLVWMDLNYKGGMSGVEMLKQLDAQGSNQPDIVAITASPESHVSSAARRNGIKVMAKPIAIDQVRELLGDRLPAQKKITSPLSLRSLSSWSGWLNPFLNKAYA